MVPTEYRYDLSPAIDNQGEHVQDVAAEDAHVKGVGLGAGGELAAKQNLLSVVAL